MNGAQTPKLSVKELLAKLGNNKKEKKALEEEAAPVDDSVSEAEVLAKEEVEAAEVVEAQVDIEALRKASAPAIKKEYQQYTSSRSSMKMITKKGVPITFINYQYITDNKECIEYLNAEIAAGLNLVEKGDLVSSEEADPMSALKKRHIEEYLAEQAIEAEKSTKLAELAEKSSTGVLTSRQVTVTGESSSASAPTVIS